MRRQKQASLLRLFLAATAWAGAADTTCDLSLDTSDGNTELSSWAAGCSCGEVCYHANARWGVEYPKSAFATREWASCRKKPRKALQARCIYDDGQLCDCGRHIGSHKHRAGKGTAAAVTTVVFVLLFVAVLAGSGNLGSSPLTCCCACASRDATVMDENQASPKRDQLEAALKKLHLPVVLYSCISIATCWGTFGVGGILAGAMGLTTIFFSGCSGNGGCACFSVVEVEGHNRRDAALCCAKRWSEHVYSFYIATGFFSFLSLGINLTLSGVFFAQLNLCKYGGPYNGYDQEWREEEGEDGKCVRVGGFPFFLMAVVSLMCAFAALALLWLSAIGWGKACVLSRLPPPPAAAQPAAMFVAPGVMMPVQAVMAQPAIPMATGVAVAGTGEVPAQQPFMTGGVMAVPAAGTVPAQTWETAAQQQQAVPVAMAGSPATLVVPGTIVSVHPGQPHA